MNLNAIASEDPQLTGEWVIIRQLGLPENLLPCRRMKVTEHATRRWKRKTRTICSQPRRLDQPGSAARTLAIIANGEVG